MTFAEYGEFIDVLARPDLAQPTDIRSGPRPSPRVNGHKPQGWRNGAQVQKDTAKPVSRGVGSSEGNRLAQGMDRRVDVSDRPNPIPNGQDHSSRPQVYLSLDARWRLRFGVVLALAVLSGFTAGRIATADDPVTIHLPHFAVGMN